MHPGYISSELTNATRRQLFRLIMGLLVWAVWANLETAPSAYAQGTDWCCDFVQGGQRRCLINFIPPIPDATPMRWCGLPEHQDPHFFENDDKGFTCLDNRCCPNPQVCPNPAGAGRICCSGLDICVDNQKCCSQGVTQVCAGVCCPVGFDACDENDQCCQTEAQFRISAVRSGPRPQMDMIVQDAEHGIGKLYCHLMVNATVKMPTFTPGTKEPLVVTVTKVDPKRPAQVELTSCTMDGCCRTGDPVLTVLRIARGRNRIRESFPGIPAAEHFISVQNGNPGLERLHVFVNGQRRAILQLSPQEVETIDIAAHMTESNVITLTGQGPAGGRGLVLISDVPGLEKARNASALLHYVEWDSDSQREDIDMHWGR